VSDLQDGEIVEIKGSGAKPYVLRNVGGVYSCTCPAWRNQSVGIERRSCKHLRKLRGEEAESQRIGQVSADPVLRVTSADKQGKEPPLLLAHSWDQHTDPTGWWMSEKLDGVRAYWDGNRFISRLGNEYRAPAWFVEGLPARPLDGELWLGRQMFQRTVSIVRRHDASDHWKEITYVIFDAPALESPFEHRQAQLHAWLGKGLAHARVLHQCICQGMDHLQSELDRVTGQGGEGVMLRQPQSLYESGRSATLFKVKTFLDAEARVVEHLPGEGRHVGRLGALIVEMPNGVRFSVGTGFTDAQRRSPPPVGAWISYRYQELSDRGVPRFPTFLRVRSDLDSSE
jgi:DNA ligase-1